MRKFTKYPQGYVKASSDGIKYYEIEFANIDENSDVSDLEPDADEYYSICIRGMRKPSIKEAEEFCREDMLKSGNNIVVNVAELTPEEAHAFYDMDREDSFPIFSTSTIKASSDITYPWVTVEFNGEIKAYGNLKDASLVKNIMEAMRRDDAFAKAMSDFYNPEYTTMEWDYSIYEEIALGIVDFCKDQYREWESLTNRGREDNPFIIISEDESIVIS